jgi:aryl-alcohol dehydrogenase-like predicted oxidoreductase
LNGFHERVELAPGYEISRVIRGGWQLAGGHGAVDEAALNDDFLAFYRAGVTVVDCADIYTGVEARIGAFRAATLARLGERALAQLKVHTKFVPDLDILPTISRSYVEGVIDRSLRRLGQERLDLVQFHWWDYAIPGWEETGLWLVELQRAGKIDLLGGTNFDTEHLEVLDVAGAPLASLQVQYSLLDDRPARGLASACRRLGCGLICYGVLAGGFLGERWLGVPDPGGAFENRSLVKYRLIIDEFGGWDLFQALLRTLSEVAARHEVEISTVAARRMLDQPGVAAVIIGARSAAHLDEIIRIGGLRLTAEDHRQIDAVLAERQGPAGEVFALERDRQGRHGRIMKYNLSG